MTDAALAHKVGSQIDAADRRSDLFERHRPVSHTALTRRAQRLL